MMDKAKIEKAIRDFDKHVREMDEAWAGLRKAIGPMSETTVYESSWRVVDAYCDAIDDAYGLDGWLNWWRFECEFGAKPRHAKIGRNKFTVATIDDLVRVVLADIAE